MVQYNSLMNQGPLQVIQHVSTHLRQARQQRGWSQEKLANEAGISRRMLINIEAGESNVSLATLDKLAHALGLTFVDLVTPPGSSSFQAVRPLRIWQGEQADSQAHLLEHQTVAGVSCELWLWQLANGESYVAEPDFAGSYEILFVLEGELQLDIEGQQRRIAAGASVSYPSDQPYVHYNAGPGLLRFTKHVVLTSNR